MSKFNNYTPDIVEQINDLDEKLVQVIGLVKKMDKRLTALEQFASSKGLIRKNKKSNETDDSCIVM